MQIALKTSDEIGEDFNFQPVIYNDQRFSIRSVIAKNEQPSIRPIKVIGQEIETKEIGSPVSPLSSHNLMPI